MGHMQRPMTGIACVFGALCWWSTAAAAPALKSPAKAAVEAAIDELRKEFQAQLRDPAVQVRTVCDYFVSNPSKVITSEAIMAALETKIDADARTAAYVRWQLLSGVPPFEVKDAAAAIAVYRKAPLPTPRVGLSAAEQAQLDRALEGRRSTDDVILTSQLEAAVRQWTKLNRHVIAYRDEWYRRLPRTVQSFAAAFEDAFERQMLAAGAEDFAPLVIADVHNWLVAGDADPPKCAALAELLAQLRAKDAPPYYGYASVRYGKLTWVKKTDSMDPRKKLTHLHQALVEAAQRPVPKPPK